MENGASGGIAPGSRRLTPAETRVLRLLAEGKSNRAIGDALHKQVSTVRHQVSSILRKLGVRTRVEAALIARDLERAEAPSVTLHPAYRGMLDAFPERAGRDARATAALAAYLRLLGDCLHDEASSIEEHPERAADVLRGFRGELLEISLKDAPVDVLLERIGGTDPG